MKILLLTTHLNTGGIGVYTVNLAKYLKDEGVSVTVASSGGDLEDRLAQKSIPHIKIDIKTKSEFSIKVWKALPVLKRLIKDDGFQIVHAQTRVAQVLAYLLEKSTGVPFVSTCHGFFKHRRLSRRLLPCWGKIVIAISNSVKKHLVDDFHVSPDRIKMIYNGIELKRFLLSGNISGADLMGKMGLDNGSMVVGAIGRLSSVKGFKYLVEAFKAVVSQEKDMNLLIVGTGPEKIRLEKQIQELGLADKVLLSSGGEPLEQYLSVMDMFCLPSVHEGLGLSLMEAMAAGQACIASDVGGISELITSDENGILVPSQDPQALTEAILRLGKDVELRKKLGANAQRKAEREFSIEDSVRQTLEVYREVVGDSNQESVNNG